ncbi:MAG: GNAT family N-acetyltransferase [Pirellulaceae bacterium]
MTSPSKHKHDFPRRFVLPGRTVVLRPLSTQDREPMVRFARGLPEDDLLFLPRDITRPAEVDQWIAEAEEGSLVTIVAWQDDNVLGYATCDRGNVRWTRHVAELRVVVAEAARSSGIGRLLLELVFEMALDAGVTKIIARMTPDQTGARSLFKRLGFEDEAVLRDHAKGSNGLTHDLLVLSFHTRLRQEQQCSVCGVLVLSALALDGARLCSHCYESRYQELGGGG